MGQLLEVAAWQQSWENCEACWGVGGDGSATGEPKGIISRRGSGQDGEPDQAV